MTTPIDIAELRRLLAEATPGQWLGPRTGYLCDQALIVAAVNSLGPLLDELERLRRENYDLRDGQFVPALTAENERLKRELAAALAEAARYRAVLVEVDAWCTANGWLHGSAIVKAALAPPSAPSSPPVETAAPRTERTVETRVAARVGIQLAEGFATGRIVGLGEAAALTTGRRCSCHSIIMEHRDRLAQRGERAGIDALLDEAMLLLNQAREKVADFVADAQPAAERKP